MIFRRDDLKVESFSELISFCLLAPFVVLLGPFLLASYTLGFVQKVVGWLDT